ncbi:MAG: hypothetical protein V1798_03385 [Pseudomonadota bacterium]
MDREIQRFDMLNPVDGKDGKTRWTRVGVAFQNDNGTLSGEILQIPLNGRLVLRRAESRKPSPETGSD